MRELELARQILEKCAVETQTISYRSFASSIGIVKAPIIATSVKVLEELIQQDVSAKRPIIAALVVQQGHAAIPRPGFFQFLVSLNVYTGDITGAGAEKWHQLEIIKLKEYYKNL